MTSSEACAALRCSPTAIGLLQARKLLSDPPNQREIQGFIRSNALLAQLDKARRESKQIEAQEAQQREQVAERKALLHNRLQVARADGDAVETSRILDELDILCEAHN